LGITGFEIHSEREIIPLSDKSSIELEENREYFLHSGLCIADSVYWGERQLISQETGSWTFSTSHWVGDCKLTIKTTEHNFHIPVRVIPRKDKLSGDLWSAILQDLESWLSGVTVGIEGGRLGSVSASGVPAPFIAEALIPLLPGFCDALYCLINNLRQIDVLVWDEVPLRMMRRVDRQTLKWVSRHPDVAVALDPWKGIGLQSPWLPRQHTEDVIDHPANRYIAWLITQVERSLSNTADALQSAAEGQSTTDDAKEWCFTRSSRLTEGATALSRIFNASPLKHLQKQPATEAAFQVVVDDPIYARVHKIGRLFLNPLFNSQAIDQNFQAAVRPSFSIYEIWCFLAVIRQLKEFLKEWVWTFAGMKQLLFSNGTGEGVIVTAKSSLGELTVRFNPSFRGFFNRGHHPRWSISKERRPDIVVTYKPSGQEDVEGAWLCLDAKYRAGRVNLSDAFDSVHIYRDSLRYEGFGGRCLSCLLLAPSETGDTKEWFSRSFIDRYHAGTWELRPGTQDNFLASWICSELGIKEL
jgi:PD-(D/E)XK nuclease superfamily